MPQVIANSYAAASLTKAVPSRKPGELATGFEQAQAAPDFADNSPAKTSPETQGTSSDKRIAPTMPPDKPRTSVLRGQPTHTSVDGPPLASAKPAASNPRPILEAFRTSGWSPRG